MNTTTSRQRRVEGSSQLEIAHARLKEDIIRFKLEPGQRVSEVELASTYQVGRAAVRMALNRLAQEKLVTVAPWEGYFVTPITLEDVEDLCGLRLVVEAAAAAAAAGRVTDTQAERLRELASLSSPHGDDEGVVAYLRGSKEFHVLIAEAAGNRLMSELVSDLFDRGRRVLHLCNVIDPGSLPRGDREVEKEATHGHILESLLAGDGDLAAERMQRHIIEVQEHLFSILVRSPNLRRINLGRQVV